MVSRKSKRMGKSLPKRASTGARRGLARAAQQDQVVGRKLETDAFHFQQQAVFLRHAVEAPAVVGHAPVQVAHVLHPLAAPGSGVEERHDAERLAGGLVDAAEEGLAGDHLRVAGRIGVDPPVHAREQCIFIIVQHPPVDEKAALVLDGHGVFAVVHAQAAHFVAAEALLDFPAGHVGKPLAIGHCPLTIRVQRMLLRCR